jgi:uncharacterized protein involved in exopolysaccharide biosynthesis
VAFLVCFIVGLCIVLNIPRQFTAEAFLIIDPRRNPVVEGGPASRTGTPWDEGAAVNTEVSMLMLPRVERSGIRESHLIGKVQFQQGCRITPA